MKNISSTESNACLIAYLKRKFAKETDCPIYEGPKSLEESDASHFLVSLQSGMGVYQVRRELLKNEVPDDDAVFEEAMVGGLEDDFPEDFPEESSD